jgi:hypothetical protein
MKRLALFIFLVAGLLLVIATPGGAKKKPAKPVIETYEATVGQGTYLRFEIEELTTEQEMQELSQSYAKGGKEYFEHALNKTEKGISFVEHDAYPIHLIQSTSEGETRNLLIVADAADRIVGQLGGQVIIGHRGYPFSFFHLQLDGQGNGKGQEVPFAAVTFNKQGIMDIKSMQVGTGSSSVVSLLNVHKVNQ